MRIRQAVISTLAVAVMCFVPAAYGQDIPGFGDLASTESIGNDTSEAGTCDSAAVCEDYKSVIEQLQAQIDSLQTQIKELAGSNGNNESVDSALMERLIERTKAEADANIRQPAGAEEPRWDKPIFGLPYKKGLFSKKFYVPVTIRLNYTKWETVKLVDEDGKYVRNAIDGRVSRQSRIRYYHVYNIKVQISESEFTALGGRL